MLFNKLKATQNQEINSLLERLRPGNEFVYADKDQAEFYGPNKPRIVKPYVKVGDELKRITELVPNLNYFLEEFSRTHKQLGVKPEKN
jgi:hypothetical protein